MEKKEDINKSDIQRYINIVRVSRGYSIGDNIIRLCESYFNHGLLGLTVAEVVEYYIYYVDVRQGLALDCVDTLNKFTIAFKDDNSLYAEYRQKAVEVIRILAFKKPCIRVGQRSENLEMAYKIIEELPILILKALGSYNEEDRTLELFGTTYTDVFCIKFGKEYGSNVEFEYLNLMYTLECDFDTKTFEVVMRGRTYEIGDEGEG